MATHVDISQEDYDKALPTHRFKTMSGKLGVSDSCPFCRDNHCPDIIAKAAIERVTGVIDMVPSGSSLSTPDITGWVSH